MQNAKPTLFLDLDGPLLDVSYKYWKVYQRVLASLGHDALSLDAYWELKRSKLSHAAILERTGAGAVAREFQARWVAKIETPSALLLDRVWPGVPQALALLRARYRIVLVTLRSSESALLEELDRLELWSSLDQVLSSGADRSPRWEIKVAMVRRAGLKPAPSDLFVGDTETDVLAGKALAVRTVAVLSGLRTREGLESFEPEFIVPLLPDLLPLLDLSLPPAESPQTSGR